MERVNEETGAKLAAYLMNELDAEGRAEVEAILAASPEAREELEELHGAFQFLAGEMAEKGAVPALAAARVEAIKNLAGAGEKTSGGANGSSARVLAVAPKRRVSRTRWLGYAAAASAAGVLTWVAVERGSEAQLRSKLARVKSDQRSLGTPLEAYYIDFNQVPPPTIGLDKRVNSGAGGSSGTVNKMRMEAGWSLNETRPNSAGAPSDTSKPLDGGIELTVVGGDQGFMDGGVGGWPERQSPQATSERVSAGGPAAAPPIIKDVPDVIIGDTFHDEQGREFKFPDEFALRDLFIADDNSDGTTTRWNYVDGQTRASTPALAAAGPQATPASAAQDELAHRRSSRIAGAAGTETERLQEGIAAEQSAQLGLQSEAAPLGQVADASGRRRMPQHYYSEFEARGGDLIEQGPPSPPAAVPRDMFFQNYGVNPFIDAAEDAQSTFAIDVDTASYTIVRNYLNRGMMPPPEAVRVEEIVNYLPNRYAAPKGETFAVYSELAPSPFRKGYHVLKVGIKGREARKAERKPMAITFVIDVSGSMAQENRLELVKATLSRLLGQLRPQDRVAIAVYGTNGRRVLSHTGLDQRWQIEQAISQLVPEGSTNAGEGLQIGYAMAREGFIQGGVNRVLLCSDGVANNGITDPNQILQMIGENAGNNVYLTTLGYGMGNYNDVLMEQLADKGNGHYAYIDSGREMEAFVDRKLIGSFDVIAQDMKIQVEFEPAAVQKYRLLGYENRDVPDAQFRNDRIDAGEIGAGHAATALYEVKFAPGAEGRAATVRLRFKQPEAGMAVKEIAGEIEIGGAKETFAAADEHTKLVAVAAQYADILRRSHWARESSMSDVERVFGEAGLRAASGAEAAELGGLISAAARMMPPLSDDAAAQAEEFEEENAPATDGGRRIQMR